VQHYLEENISEFSLQLIDISLVQRFQCFIALLEKVLSK
jgi:hypothetical protein